MADSRCAGLLLPPADRDTEPASVRVLAIERIGAGRLLGFAEVEISIAGVVFTLCGIRIVRTTRNTLGIEPPQFRGRDGASRPAVLLPPELAQAIGSAVLDAAEESVVRLCRG